MNGSNSAISLITLSRSRSCRASGGRTNGSGSTRAVDDLHDQPSARARKAFRSAPWKPESRRTSGATGDSSRPARGKTSGALGPSARSNAACRKDSPRKWRGDTRARACRDTSAAAISVMPRDTRSTGIRSRHLFALLGSCRKNVPSRYESDAEVLMPSFQPRNGFSIGRLHDGRPHHGDRRAGRFVQIIPDQRFGKALGQRIGIRPAQLVRAAHARFGKHLPQPAKPILANLIFQRRAVQILGRVLLFSGRARESLRSPPRIPRGPPFRASELPADGIPPRRQSPALRSACSSSAKLLEHAPVPPAHHVACGEMQQRGMIASGQKIQQVLRRAHIHRQRIAQVRIEIRQTRAVHDQIHRPLDSLRALPAPDPDPACVTSPSTTSTRVAQETRRISRRGAAARGPKTGDSSTTR